MELCHRFDPENESNYTPVIALHGPNKRRNTRWMTSNTRQIFNTHFMRLADIFANNMATGASCTAKCSFLLLINFII